MLEMRHLIALMIALIFSSSVWFLGQGNSIQSRARLVHRYERRCGHSCAQELAIDLGGVYAKKPDDMVVVRFCSKEALPLALSTSAAAYGYVISILTDSYGYTAERILFLRSESCLGPALGVTATEFWAIPQGAALPDSVEIAKSNQVRLESLAMEGLIGNARSYKAALQRLPERLRANPGGRYCAGLLLQTTKSPDEAEAARGAKDTEEERAFRRSLLGSSCAVDWRIWRRRSRTEIPKPVRGRGYESEGQSAEVNFVLCKQYQRVSFACEGRLQISVHRRRIQQSTKNPRL